MARMLLHQLFTNLETLFILLVFIIFLTYKDTNIVDTKADLKEAASLAGRESNPVEAAEAIARPEKEV
jgi:hypothetical protein